MHALVLLLILTPALTPTPALAANPPSMGAAALQMGWALLVVVGLILALYGLAKKRLSLGKLGGNAIKVIEIRPLLPKSTLALVEVSGRQYLLGVSGDQIRLLAEVTGDGDSRPDFPSLLAQQP